MIKRFLGWLEDLIGPTEKQYQEALDTLDELLKSAKKQDD